MKNENKNQIYPSEKMTAWNIVLVVLTILANILVAFVLIYISNYSALSKNIFIWVNVGTLAVLLLIDLLVYFSIRSMNKKVYIIAAVILCASLAAGSYGTYVSTRVQNNIDNMTSSTQTSDVNAAFVIYSGNSGSVISSTADLEGKTIAVSKGTQTASIAEKKLQNDGINATYKEYSGYTEAYRALVTGEVQCAVLPVTWESLVEEDESLSTFAEKCSSILNFSDSVTDTNKSGADKDLTKEPFTILLTGENEGLADTIMVLSVNPVSMKVTMTSIARDSYVPISCYGNTSSKINGAHAVSESCMVDTVEQLLGITIDYTVEFNFASVIQVVDAVGGVDVDISVGFDAQCWDIEKDELEVYHLDAGDNVHLDGTRALGYARERMAFVDGDFARQRHQQEIISQVLTKIMATKDPNTILKVMDAAGSNISTNFTRDQLVNFISYAMQKATRYYGDSLSGVFNIVHSRIYGSDSTVYDPSYGMNLYIYKINTQSLNDTVEAIERNMNLNSKISTSTPVSWSAGEEYDPPDISD
jgi:LCP family protein required for cell wall assembly